ncbi:MAG: DUF2147 domain-containing protein [Paludibacteraceae bacterium]|nr:DUF2147 domain-containing protein [Paludibacteraceae bacterium]
MKKTVLTAVLGLMTMAACAQVNQIVGDWKTVDDKTGEKKSVVHIFKATDGLYYGKIIDLLKGPKDCVCIACEGADNGKPIIGLQIIRGMKEENGELVGGHVLDPESGKMYYAKLYLKDGKLVLRGSLDKKGMLGRNQIWVR